VRYDGIHSTIIPTDRQSDVAVTSDFVRKTGETYRVPVGTFHETVVSITDEVLTFVVCTNFKTEDPLVLGHAGSVVNPYQREAFDTDHFWSRVKENIGNPDKD
ncbi:MAG TPA: hypothetical protein VMH92_01845, partial [Acidocella sp.]|nr:hypothetical protein [Acidocella sp.]